MPLPDPAPVTDVLVVGAGLAGTATVAELRRRGFTGSVRVLGAEPVAPYDRPPLSKQLLERDSPRWLADEIGADLLQLADDVRLAEPATGLDLSGRHPQVRTAHAVYPARTVVLASGSRALTPAGWQGAARLQTFADAAELRATLGRAHRLVVIGAGWVGSEVAGVAAAAGHDVTVVEGRAAPLGLDAVASRTSSWFEASGVRLLLSTQVAAVRPGAVELTDGRTLAADLVLAAVGAAPATEWLAGTLPRTADGRLLVDERMRVLDGPTGAGRADVRALGDVATRRSARHGWVRGGHWDAALRGARTLAADLTKAAEAPDDPAPYVFSQQLGHDLALFGTPSAHGEVVLRESGRSWSALWVRDGALEAALVVDHPREVGAVRRLMSGPTLPRIDPEQARDPGRPLTAAP